MAQQSYEDQPLLDLVEILNVSSGDGRESSLNTSLEEVLAVNAIDKTTVISDEISKISRPESAEKCQKVPESARKCQRGYVVV